MSRYEAPQADFALPRPGRALWGVMIALFVVWLAFAIGLNWGGASDELFMLLCGNTEQILHGQVWRLFTAPFMHIPSGSIGHIVTALLGLYFLSPALEQRFGSRRFLQFLFLSALIAYGLQMALELALPASIAGKLVPEYWFGAMPVIEAIAIAWALSFKGQVVRLMFVIPVTSRGLIIFVIAMSVMYMLAGAQTPAGMIAPFGGMLSGWLLGGGSPSPLKKWWLKFRLARLEQEAYRDRTDRKRRAEQSGLRVISGEKGGLSGEKGTNGTGGKDQGPDGRFLN